MIPSRQFKPVPTFESEIHPLRRRQFHWTKQSEGLEIATFAGKEMMVCLNDDGETFQLSYLDMAHPLHFASVDEAKAAAFDFARAVLLAMLEIVGVREEDKSLQHCLLVGGA